MSAWWYRVLVASAAAALPASTRLGRQFLSDRVFLWEPDYPVFQPPSRLSVSLSRVPVSLRPALCSSLTSPLASPRALLSCWFPCDVNGRRGPIATRTELWSETVPGCDGDRCRREGWMARGCRGPERVMQAGLRYPGLWTTSYPSTTTTTYKTSLDVILFRGRVVNAVFLSREILALENL